MLRRCGCMSRMRFHYGDMEGAEELKSQLPKVEESKRTHGVKLRVASPPSAGVV
jgi:hypothetical protein